MPELPEVETVLRGIAPYLVGKKIAAVVLRHQQLRWPIPKDLAKKIVNCTLNTIERRGKYLLFCFNNGTLIIHLGMSGKLSLVSTEAIAKKHDHCDLIFANHLLRYHDPRRFGAILWTAKNPADHPLLKPLGPEPLTSAFNANFLMASCRAKKTTIKNIIMNSHIVVGVGNIYANEALFQAKIHPAKPGYLLDLAACQSLVRAIKAVLKKSIRAGGTSLKDFMQTNGEPGYFKQSLQVYSRHNQPCVNCHQLIQLSYQQQRATYFCLYCQKL